MLMGSRFDDQFERLDRRVPPRKAHCRTPQSTSAQDREASATGFADWEALQGSDGTNQG